MLSGGISTTTSRISRRHVLLILIGLILLSDKSIGFSTRNIPTRKYLYSPSQPIPKQCVIVDDRILPHFSSATPNNDENTVSPTTVRERILNSSFFQFPATLALYVFHMSVLSQHHIVLPFQLIPNPYGHFASIGLDSLTGFLVFAVYMIRRKRPETKPWQLPSEKVRFRLSTLVTSVLLVQAYFLTGRFSLFWEDLLYTMSAMGWPLTVARHRSLTVLLGHLNWLVVGTLLLRWLPRPPPFFRPTDKFRWFTSRRRNKQWWLWVIGGYAVSSWLFNVADIMNVYLLPQNVLQNAPESVVAQLINPEHNDRWAYLFGYIAPCLTAPWWEEILYRGFLLAALSQVFPTPFWPVTLQGILFSAHHMSLTAALPLAVLGWIWALLYQESRNLWNVILIHCLWNSRVFLGSWLGL